VRPGEETSAAGSAVAPEVVPKRRDGRSLPPA
jgi:hypothetical protein